MPEVALLLWLVYGVGALGLRVALQLWRTGSTGIVGARAPAGSIAWFGELAHSIALSIGLAAPVLALVGIVEPIAALDETFVHAIGITLFTCGLSVVVTGQAQMGSSWRIGTDPRTRTPLVTSGLFAIIRNPIYSALIVTLLGLALLVASVVAIASVVLFAIAVEVETRLVEEPHLMRTHGNDYGDYATRVGRFLPIVGRLRREPAGRQEPPIGYPPA